MNHLEPSYLRYIYDGLEKGDLHPDNAAALPEGITGLYEAAFEENKPARERQKLLETFAIWALLKKDVSAQFVAEILKVPSEEIIDFIATYSSWFTSPESGKYQLYHERLKVFLLQKLSEQETATLHDKLVSRIEQAIAEQKDEEFEIYGLEYLSVHYFTTSMITGNGTKLITLSYNQNHWQRQLKLSKGFEWTIKGLKQVMTWASKFNDEEVIECGLQMVDLYHQEQNDAPQIVALVAEGEIEATLKRIEAFGGNDKEGLQRKFILYMLCLMELTLLESKDKPFRKELTEKLLKHFDENLVIDHSVLNWDDFFPSYLMFQIASKLIEIGSNHLIIYNRNKKFIDWENEKNNNVEFEKRKKINNEIIKINYLKIETINSSINELENQINKDEFNLAENESPWGISNYYLEYGIKSLNNNDFRNGLLYIELAYLYTDKIEIDEDDNRGIARWNMSNDLVDNGYNNLALYTMPIINTDFFDFACRDLANKFEKQNDLISLQNLVVKSNYENRTVIGLVNHLTSLKNYYDIRNQLINIIKTKKLNYSTDSIIKDVSFELIKNKNYSLVFEFIKIDTIHFRILDEILNNLIKEEMASGNYLNAFELIKRIFDQECKASNIKNYLDFILNDSNLDYIIKNVSWTEDGYRETYHDIIFEKIIQKSNLETALLKLDLIKDKVERKKAIIGINIGLFNKLDYIEFSSYFNSISEEIIKFNILDKILNFNLNNASIQIVINSVLQLSNILYKAELLIEITSKITSLNTKEKIALIDLAFIETNYINNPIVKSSLLKQIAEKLILFGNKHIGIDIYKQAIIEAKAIEDYKTKTEVLIDLSEAFFQLGDIDNFSILINDAFNMALKIVDDWDKYLIFRNICYLLIENNQLEKPIEIANLLDNSKQINIILLVSLKHYQNGNIERSNFLELEAFNKTKEITIEKEKINSFLELFKKLLEKNNHDFDNSIFDECLEYILKTNNNETKCKALIEISILLIKNKMSLLAGTILEKAIDYANNIKDDGFNSIIKEISKISIENGFYNLIERISKKGIKNELLKNIGNKAINSNSYHLSLDILDKFDFYVNKKVIKHGIINNANTTNINLEFTNNVIKDPTQEVALIEHVLQMYALNQLFFENLPEEKIQRYERTLNIQWAIDIKNQLPN